MINRTGFFFICILVLTSCVASDGKNNSVKTDDKNINFDELRDKSLLPSWFFHPSPGNSIGSLGISRTVTIGHKPEYFARKYALLGLLDYFGIGADDNNQSYNALLNGEKDSAVIGGRTFSIPNMLKSKDYIVARAVYGDTSVSGIKSNEFSPYECKPEWICSPASGSMGGVLGVSYRAVSPQRQYELAVKNGLLLLKYSYGVDVSGTEEIRRLRSGTGVIRLRKNNLSLKTLGNAKSIKLYVKEVRFVKETLYLRLVSPDLPAFDSDNSWRFGNIKAGAVGECGRTASNLLSNQINKAVEKAIFGMAKNKELGINVYELVKKSSYSSVFDQIIESSVNTKVFPRLSGFYLTRDQRVRVWLVPD